MTELYRGPWDVPKAKAMEDPYHPKYPDVNGRITPDYANPAIQAVVQQKQVAVRRK